MSDLIDAIEEEQIYLRERYERNVQTQDSTLRRTAMFSVAEGIAVIAIALVQVLIVRNFFDAARRPLGGV